MSGILVLMLKRRILALGLLLGLACWTGPAVFAADETVPPMPFEPVDWGEAVTSRDATVRSVRPGRPDDPFLTKQYWLENVGQADDKGRIGFPRCDLKAFDAWKLYKPKQEIFLAIGSTSSQTNSDTLSECRWGHIASQPHKTGILEELH